MITKMHELCRKMVVDLYLLIKTSIDPSSNITENSSSILDLILTNSAEKVSQSAVINFGLSDHQLIYFTQKVIRGWPNKQTIPSLTTIQKHFYKKLEVEFHDYSCFQKTIMHTQILLEKSLQLLMKFLI